MKSALMIIAILALVAPSMAAVTPQYMAKEVGIDQKLNEQVPKDITLRDESGREVKLGDYFRGRPVILTLVYYGCPMMCTQVLNGTLTALRAVKLDPGKDYDIITVSFDPSEDHELATEKKASYTSQLKKPGIQESWHFFTGAEDQIKRLTSAVGFRYVYDEKTNQFAHAAGIMVLTGDGRVSRYFYGVEYSARDLRLGLVEASEGKIGTPTDAVLLLCFHYDPLNGRYAATTLNLIRLGGLLTVLALGSYILMQVRSELKARALAAQTAATQPPEEQQHAG